MATSGTTNFIMTRDQIITDALSKINAIGLGDTPSADMIAEAQTVLNMMVQHWQNFNIFLWTKTDATVALESGTASYYLGRAVLEVSNFFFRDSDGFDTHLESITGATYANISDKDMAGTPSQVYVEYLSDGPKLTLWPVYGSTDGTLGYTSITRLQDFSASADNPDFSSRWYKSLCLGLAVDLAPTWGRLKEASFQALVALSEAARNQAKYGQNESSNLTLRPRMR